MYMYIKKEERKRGKNVREKRGRNIFVLVTM